MNETNLLISGLLLGFGVGFFAASIVAVLIVYIKGDALIHRIRYKKWVLPCPSCRDEETDKPTGEMPPQSHELAAALKKAGAGPNPIFDCGTCKGTKRIVYEFPRLSPPKINERQILEGPAPGQPQPKKGLLG